MHVGPKNMGDWGMTDPKSTLVPRVCYRTKHRGSRSNRWANVGVPKIFVYAG